MVTRDFLMAAVIIREYCGKFPEEINDPFFKYDNIASTKNTYVHRVIFLADALFRLRNEDGFEVLRGRFEQRPIRSVYFEATAASYFIEERYNVVIREETGVRGNDFDFAVFNNKEKINVEVSEFSSDQFSASMLKNKLNEKRSQLPPEKPAILFLTCPESWDIYGPLDFPMMRETFSFFGRTKRINAVVFQSATVKNVGPGFAWIVHSKRYVNSSARHPFSANFLFKHSDDVSGELIVAAKNGDDLNQYLLDRANQADLSNSYSFLDWVRDHI